MPTLRSGNVFVNARDVRAVVDRYSSDEVPMPQDVAVRVLNLEISFREACRHFREDDRRTGYDKLLAARPSVIEVLTAVLVLHGITEAEFQKMNDADLSDIFVTLRLPQQFRRYIA